MDMDHKGMDMTMENPSPPPTMSGGHMEMGHGAHGGWFGHVLPGSFFLIWSTWWAVNIFAQHIVRRNSRKGFRTRPWFLWKWWAVETVEPYCKILLPFIGILCELRFAKKRWRTMVDDDGHFIPKQINNWQHSMMYGAVMVSGTVDLMGYYTKYLPSGTEQVFLSLSFLVESILMVFHLKGPELEVKLHLMLVLIMFACSLACMLELVWQHSVLLTTTRTIMVFFQGTWFIQSAHILYLHIPAWDMELMGGAMFLPVVFTFHLLMISFCFVLVYVAMAVWYTKVGAPLSSSRPSIAIASRSGDHGGSSSDSEDNNSGRELQVLVAKEYVD